MRLGRRGSGRIAPEKNNLIKLARKNSPKPQESGRRVRYQRKHKT